MKFLFRGGGQILYRSLDLPIKTASKVQTPPSIPFSDTHTVLSFTNLRLKITIVIIKTFVTTSKRTFGIFQVAKFTGNY